MAAKVMKWGNSLAALIPAFAAKSLGLVAGSEIRVLVLDDGIVIRPASAPRNAAPIAPPSYSDEVRSRLQRW